MSSDAACMTIGADSGRMQRTLHDSSGRMQRERDDRSERMQRTLHASTPVIITSLVHT